MKVFEDKYDEDASIAEVILLSLKALHAATEGRFNVNNVEIGVITLEDRRFRKMDRDEVRSYIDQFEGALEE